MRLLEELLKRTESYSVEIVHSEGCFTAMLFKGTPKLAQADGTSIIEALSTLEEVLNVAPSVFGS